MMGYGVLLAGSILTCTALRVLDPEQAMRVRQLYAQVNVAPSTNKEQAEAWKQEACPWEEGRHSGFWLGMSNTQAALDYAESHVKFHDRSLVLQRLAGKRFVFRGDSVQRQFSQAFMCYLRRITPVKKDDSTWAVWPWGRANSCPLWPNAASSASKDRHCYMGHSEVQFENGITVAFKPSGSPMLSNAMIAEDNTKDTIVVFSQTHHGHCDEACWKKFNNLPASNATFVLKEKSIQHFQSPGKQGDYAKDFHHSSCVAAPVSSKDRMAEVDVGIPIVQSKGWHVLQTFEEIDKPAWSMHSAEAPGLGVDCTHWLLPGVPDVWVSKLIDLMLNEVTLK